ncbi:MAG: hypothetical protein IJA41_10955 [Clostridia bacterium]|nr:hypothetical protein [Clostridia bacterium]
MVCKKLIDYLVATLSANEALTDMTVITEFPSKRQDLPLENAVVSVGLEGVDITGVGDALQIAADASPVNYTVGLTLCVPKSATGAVCHSAVDGILSALATFVAEYSVTDITVGQMKYSGTLGALTVPITLKIFNGNAY